MNHDTRWIESCLRPPDEQPDAWMVETFSRGAHSILFARPRDPDRLLDDPTVHSASRAHDYMPYWAYLWPGAELLAEHLLSNDCKMGMRTLEIGCGLGLAGLAALRIGMIVTFSDYSPAALALAAYNARLNGLTRSETRLVDWQNPPRESFELILGADVLYESRCLNDVLRVLDTMLAPLGTALLSDPGRAVADRFCQCASERGYSVDEIAIETRLSSGRAIRGRIFSVQSRSERHQRQELPMSPPPLAPCETRARAGGAVGPC